MSSSRPNALQQRCQHIVTSPTLTPEQKRHFLALEAENNLPYPALPSAARAALDEGVICDMFEGHAPYKPRYVLPDYAKFLANGSDWLELEGANDLDDALSLLTILYHHVPSVTSMPVYLGQLDALLDPYVKILTQDEIDSRIKRFWRYLDRTLPDAFMHANIGRQIAPSPAPFCVPMRS
ncbi:protein YjjI [Enterobacter cancerogenus]|uniref:Protein YjjI n=1 Tax=Enterobacter cancerogenus TaxID=69218 RepID=A0A484VXN5_9ENTR|nr:protein YjjI [Enterobacter cancerogenus]